MALKKSFSDSKSWVACTVYFVSGFVEYKSKAEIMHDATAANAVKMEIIKKNTSFLVGLYHQVENRTRAHEKSPGGEPGEMEKL